MRIIEGATAGRSRLRTRLGTALALGSGLAALAACGGGSPPGGDDAAALDTTPIRAQLEPDTLRRVGWGPATPAIAPDGTWRTYGPATTWNWQLQGEIRTDREADVYVLDLFAQLDGGVRDELNAAGRDALCYFSVGTHEPWRPDAGFFTADMQGEPHAGFPDERWLDVANPEVVRIMVNRLDMAKAIGCDGVELDNVDGYRNRSGFDITEAQELEFARTLANEAHRRGLAVALKNAPLILAELVDWFDLSINEQCFQYRECARYTPMIAAGKPVFNAEYRLYAGEGTARVEVPATSPAGRAALCAKAAAANIRATLLPVALDGSFRFACDP